MESTSLGMVILKKILIRPFLQFLFPANAWKVPNFFPFQKLIGAGVASLMVGHLNVPALDEGKPASISYKIVSGLIKQQLGFQGLIFSDALGMKGVADYAESSQVDLQAFLAGNDVLLMSSDPIKGIETLKNAYSAGTINEYRLAHSVKKILKAKYWAGLNKVQTSGSNQSDQRSQYQGGRSPY